MFPVSAVVPVIAEGSSYLMAGGLGPCLMKPERSQQAVNDNQHQDCPTFLAGTLIVFERGYHWIRHDDNDKAVVAAFTVVLALSTIGLWLATNKLWAAGEKQFGLLRKANEISEKSVWAANRAWVGIERVRTEEFEIGKPIRVLVVIKNTGHSPALQVRGEFNGALLKKEEAPDSPLTTRIESAATVLIPNGSYHYSPFSGHAALTQQELESILAGDILIWIVGRVDYNDANGQSHYSIYKLNYDIKDKGFGTAIDGNDAT